MCRWFKSIYVIPSTSRKAGHTVLSGPNPVLNSHCHFRVGKSFFSKREESDWEQHVFHLVDKREKNIGVTSKFQSVTCHPNAPLLMTNPKAAVLEENVN